mmetsp:Transcript_32828/g.94093  ORF Transcript_32828/g.94093 Transcript_32828/m.94093 type:complete len:90 (+) Transcript_32828:115-384(+)|eukprot:CAMPEP_0168372358 /NCGR_PEP_ID=MMETSP0228-20121227/8241_1 /TAXON_ID=133427 /ORGANISM="Protoceratium reticulatum, Strain CCCM 535 (=CCMP 1889)" /LENGTH=89 /DNA_ID=CAMNT_0008385265 /DNA_START=62 /DNA_END=331 /DNA_ORIENTATION=-
MVFATGNPDFNRPVTLQISEEPTGPSPQKSTMEMDQFLKKYFGEPPQAPHGSKFKADPKAWYEHTVLVKFPDVKSKKKVKSKVKAAGRE